jgi:hypothetical protein
MLSHEVTVQHSSVMRNQRQQAEITHDSVGQQGMIIF